MVYFVALLLLVGVYVVVKFLLSKVPPLASIADVIAVLAGIFTALWYAGVLR